VNTGSVGKGNPRERRTLLVVPVGRRVAGACWA
jgi:hypothetical protein